MKIKLRKLRANLGWYTGTARVPPPRIWREGRRGAGPATRRPERAGPRLRAKRWRTAPRSLLGTFLIVVIVGVVLFVLFSGPGLGSEGNRVLRGMGIR